MNDNLSPKRTRQIDACVDDLTTSYRTLKRIVRENHPDPEVHLQSLRCVAREICRRSDRAAAILAEALGELRVNLRDYLEGHDLTRAQYLLASFRASHKTPSEFSIATGIEYRTAVYWYRGGNRFRQEHLDTLENLITEGNTQCSMTPPVQVTTASLK